MVMTVGVVVVEIVVSLEMEVKFDRLWKATATNLDWFCFGDMLCKMGD
jgi:hypothetical protein